MQKPGLKRIVESGTFDWPWSTAFGLAIITGAAGGGGGGGGALCVQGLNLYGAAGGGGGGGGAATTVKIGQTTYQAAGGNGGAAAAGGSLIDGEPMKGTAGAGCQYGDGGDGGRGAMVTPNPDRIVSDGGDGGRGFPAETLVVDLADLSLGDTFQVTVGVGGGGGSGGEGYEAGDMGAGGLDGSVLFVPIFEVNGAA